MICSRCGKENPKDSNYCIVCGEELSPEVVEQKPSDTPDYNQQSINNYMTFSIITTILTMTFCCGLPLGVIALIYSSQVNSYMKVGDINKAIETSKKARKWNIISLIVSMSLFIILLFILLMVALVSLSYSGAYRFHYFF